MQKIVVLNIFNKSQGKRVEVMAFGRTTSLKLKEIADEFIDMDENLPKFLLKK